MDRQGDMPEARAHDFAKPENGDTAPRLKAVPAPEPPVADEAPQPGRWRRLMRRRGTRRLLMWGVPLLIVLVGGYTYLTGGRYVSTDDAYVKSGMVTISADVAGRVTEIAVRENEHVKEGQVLFRLDERPFRYALERASGNLAQTRLQIDGLRANYRQKLAELQAARDTLEYNQRQFERAKALIATRATSQATFDAAQRDVLVGQQNVASLEQQIASLRASLGGNPDIPTDDHPLVLQAQAQVDQAALDLERTTVRAPVAGTTSKVDSLQVGQYLNVGTAAFALVSTRLWIEANFKETELTHMATGNTATVTVDTYPGKTFQARVESIGAATGSEFSILPPQNATGNWVKVTQRLPVRVTILDPDPKLPLRAGMSVTVEVDTKYRRPALAVIEDAFAGGTR